MPVSSGIVIPISILLLPLLLFLLLYIFYSIFNVYHLLRFGVYGFDLYIISAVFMLGTIALLGTSAFFLMRYDWGTPIRIDQLLEVEESTFPGL